MKSAFFIMRLWQSGMIDPCQIVKIKEQPENGFETYQEAFDELKMRYNQSDFGFIDNDCTHTIMQLFFPS